MAPLYKMLWALLVLPMDPNPLHDPVYKRLQRLYFLSAQNASYFQAFEDTLQLLIRRYGPYPSLQMYRYGALALKARYTSNLLEKKDYLYSAIASMDAQVKRTPNDLEVRFIRGSFYYYLPFFLGKRKAAQEDVKAMVRLLQDQSATLKTLYDKEVLQAIVEFLAQTDWVEKEEIDKLRRLYT